jgi:hypothetical protein
MSPTQLKRLWAVIGTILVFYSLNAWLVSQGVNSIFKVTLLDSRPRFESLFAIPVCSVLLILLCHIGLVHARVGRAKVWHARLPVVGLDDLDTGTLTGKLYQAFFAVVFLLVPVAGLIHFLQKVASINLVRDGQILSAHFFDRVPWNELYAHSYALANGVETGTPPKVSIVAFWPDGEPILFLGLVVLAIAHVAWLGMVLFRGGRARISIRPNRSA